MSEALLKGAEIAYPNTETPWRIAHDDVCYDRFSGGSATAIGGRYMGSIFFDPLNNDSNWVALREGLDKHGISLYWYGNEWFVDGRGWKQSVIYSRFDKLSHKDPRQLAMKVLGALTNET